MSTTPLYFVRPDEDWVRQSGTVLSATSEQFGYEAAKAATDDPARPWWATSGTATLTVTFAGAREIGLIALIMTNADDTRTITLGGGITGSPTLTGTRELSAFPRDLHLIVEPPQSLSAITFAIAGNTNKWSIGRVVAGKRRSLVNNWNLATGFKTQPSRGMEIDPGVPAHGHDIRYDVGVDHWKASGHIILKTADFVEAKNWWFATKMGYLPTLILTEPTRYPVMFARMTMGEYTTKPTFVDVPMEFVTVGRGLEVVG